MYRIAIIEDDMDQARLIAFWLKPYGFEATLYISAELFMEALDQGMHFDLLLIDWILPGADGLSLIKTLSQRAHCPPAIFITSKDREEDLAVALHSGADDFISKPLSKTVLLARIGATLRRNGRSNGSHQDRPALHLDEQQGLLRIRGQQVRLTNNEFRLLKLFLQLEQNTLLSRDELADALWGDSDKADQSRAVDLLVSRLRKKINTLSPPPIRILSHYGQGYALEYTHPATVDTPEAVI